MHVQYKRIMDISRSIYPGMVKWPGDQGFEVNRECTLEKGNVCNLSSVRMSVHTGTHVDAPFHFIAGGTTVAELDLSRFIGVARVFEINVQLCITGSDIEQLPIKENDIVLFKTSNSLIPYDGEFHKDYVYMDVSAAKYLIDKRIKAVGVDYLSIDGFYTEDYAVHKLLLSKGVGIIEGLMLKDVAEGSYFLSCLPLKLEGADGSPVRAVLLEI